MTFQIALLLVILVAALVLFSFEWIAADVVALGILVLLVLTGLLPAERAFGGFGSETVMMILGLLILTAALVRTGVVELVGRAIQRRTGSNPNRILAILMGASALLSSFISNTASTAFFIPIAMGLARRARISASRLLMPLAFASILASSVTLIGTSTNVVVSGLMTQYGLPPLGMFELTVVGLPIALMGLLYMYVVGPRLVPQRSGTEVLADEFNLRPYLTEISIEPGSSLVDTTLAASGLGRDYDLTVLRVMRESEDYVVPHGDLVLQAGDVLLVQGKHENMLKIQDKARIGVGVNLDTKDIQLETNDIHMAEVILMPRSPLIGRRLVRAGLREQYGVQVLAINRHEETIHSQISQERLQMGDVLLVQGPQTSLAGLERANIFRILGMLDGTVPNFKRAPRAVAIFAGAILAAVFGVTTLPVAVLAGAVLAFITGCITPQEAYNDVEWKAVILIGSMLALGMAMESTGTARYLAGLIVNLVGSAGPLWLLTGFFVLTVALTQPMSNQAAAVMVFPIAMQTATLLGLNPRTFAVMIAVAASTSFITPLEPACLLVYGLGRYRFLDFIKVGSLLTVLIFIIAITLTPIFWPLGG